MIRKICWGFLFLIFVFALFTKIDRTKAQGTDLFISEYVEGASNNKALEIYNPTENAVDLSGYKLLSYVNGSTTISNTYLFSIGVFMNPGTTYILCNQNSSAALLAKCNLTVSGTGANTFTFTGNDAVVLAKTDETPVDVIGQIGNNPVSDEWGTDLTSTTDNTLVRKCNIIQGDINGSDIFDPSLEWVGYAKDTFDNLGTHNLCVDTASPTPILSPTPTLIPSSSPTSEPTITPTPTEAPTNTPLSTITPTNEPTFSPTLSPTFSPTLSPTPNATPKNNDKHKDHWMKKFIENCKKYIHNSYEKLHEDSHNNHKKWPSHFKFFHFGSRH